MSIRDTRTLSPAEQEVVRRRVVHAVHVEGLPKGQAARVFHVSRTSLNTWLAAYGARGEDGLVSGKRGRRPHPRLAPAQAAEVQRLLEEHGPEELGLPFALWTREAVGQLLAQRWGVHVSVRTVGRYLAAWGFTPQKPVRRAYERDPQAITRWLEVEYPALVRRAKAQHALIHWGDEMGLRSTHQSGTSYGRRGHTPAIPGTGQRFGCNLIAALTNQGQLSFKVFRQRFTTAVFLDFLRRLIRQPYLRGRKVFLIVDGHPVHRAAAVGRWVARHAAELELILLPGYAPELNPGELLNQDTKSATVGRRRPHDSQQLVHSVRTYLHSTQREPQIVQRYFLEEHVRYAADPLVLSNHCRPE